MSGALNKWGGWVMSGKRNTVTFSIWKAPDGYSARLDVSGADGMTKYLPTFQSRDEVVAHATPIVAKLGVDVSGMANARTKLSIYAWRGMSQLDMMTDLDYNPDDHLAQAEFRAKMQGLQQKAQAELDKRLPKPPEQVEPPDPADWWKQESQDEVTAAVDSLIREFSDRLEARVSAHKDQLHLLSLQAKTDAPPGTGSAFMTRLARLADQRGLILTLQTASKGDRYSDVGKPKLKFKQTTSAARLKRFYGRFGFRSNYAARSYRSDLPGNMHRLPRKVGEASVASQTWPPPGWLSSRPTPEPEVQVPPTPAKTGARVTFIGGIQNGKVKVVKDAVTDYDPTFTVAANHASLGMRPFSGLQWTKFRACEGVCFWWDPPTAEDKRLANDAVVELGGPPIDEHVFIEDAEEWIERLVRREKAQSKPEYTWQRAHYESRARALITRMTEGTREARVQAEMDRMVDEAPGSDRGEKLAWVWANKPAFAKLYRSLGVLYKHEQPTLKPYDKRAIRYYVRFADRPPAPGFKSSVWYGGKPVRHEKGISAYAATWNRTYGAWELERGDGLAAGPEDSIEDVVSGRLKAWLITGPETGEVGSDSEPLLNGADVQVVKQLTPLEMVVPGYYCPDDLDPEYVAALAGPPLVPKTVRGNNP